MDTARREAARALVQHFIDAYNRHDASACASLYAPNAILWDQPWNEKHEGREAIRTHYAQEFEASPDIQFVSRALFESNDALAVEFLVRGTHDGTWRGLPATGHRFELVAWSMMRMSIDGSQIIDSRYTYDRATIFHQIGVLHDPESLLGKTLTALTHPVTMARAARKRISVRPGAPH